MAKNWKGPRPVAQRLVEAVMLDLFPDSPAVIADFFISDQQHYEALYYPIRAGEITVDDLDRVLDDPEAITKLVNASPSNPHRGIVFGFGPGLGKIEYGSCGVPRKQWLFHVAAHDDADTFAFGSKEAAEETRSEIVKAGGVEMVSKIIAVEPGDKHWVVHVKKANGKMHSFGFRTKPEAIRFRKVLLKKVESIRIVSEPVEATVEG